MPQQPCPHASPSLHVMGAAPSGHVALHISVEGQCTRHAPVHVTSQLPEESHVTLLESPTVGAQSFTFVHMYVESAPVVTLHVPVPVHVTVQ